MKVFIWNVDVEILENGEIIEHTLFQGILPSINDNWRFNFNKHSKKKEFKTYVLITDENKTMAQGCLIFEMRETVEPYMAYIEVAPHNRGNNKVYDRIAGCLIAYACRLSFIYGERDYKGWLAFDVLEESKENEIRLMALYSSKYKAMRIENSTTMIISPENGESLINEFLNN